MRALIAKLRETLDKHHEKLWWAHSIYALCLGVVVVLLAHRKFHLVKWLILVLVVIWIGLLVYQRWLIGHAETRARKGVKIAFNYIMKNLYQQMFFFMIPFYYDSTTFGSANMWFLFVLVVCAIVSTNDIIFDRYVMETRWLATIFYCFCFFASFNLFLPLLFGIKNVVSIYLAGILCILSYTTLHFRPRQIFSNSGLLAIVVAIGLFLTLLRWGRSTIPPAPLRQVNGQMAVGRNAKNGKPEGRFYRIHIDDLNAKDRELYCFTAIETPLKIREDIRHVWQHEGRTVKEKTFRTVHSKSEKGVLLFSKLRRFPDNPLGAWIVKAVTTGGQLVGETRFLVVR